MKLLSAITLCLTVFAGACDDASTPADTTSTVLGGKADSGWLGADTFEVEAVVTSIVRQELTGDWAPLDRDETLQIQLIDDQLKFIKNTAEGHGWRFNQLSDEVRIIDISVTADNEVEIFYEAVVDMLGRYTGRVPALADIDPREFTAYVPTEPVGIGYRDIQDCSETDGSHGVSDYNFHYYFAPDAADCTLETIDASLEITEVFPREVVYPEYDQLMQPLNEDGSIVGFTAALVPNVGDSDRMSRFNAHADMLERELRLTGVDAEDGSYRRYTWDEDGGVRMVIDLYDPTKIEWTSSFEKEFRERLGAYTLIHYNGHSAYGTKHLLDDPESFSDAYQIVMLHSCQSYAYYTRQVFRAKATDADPSGFALADIVATGKSSYPSGSPPTLREVLSHLMDGISVVAKGRPGSAPSWNAIVEAMDDSTRGDIMYGVAGVRDNRWQP